MFPFTYSSKRSIHVDDPSSFEEQLAQKIKKRFKNSSLIRRNGVLHINTGGYQRLRWVDAAKIKIRTDVKETIVQLEMEFWVSATISLILVFSLLILHWVNDSFNLFAGVAIFFALIFPHFIYGLSYLSFRSTIHRLVKDVFRQRNSLKL